MKRSLSEDDRASIDHLADQLERTWLAVDELVAILKRLVKRQDESRWTQTASVQGERS